MKKLTKLLKTLRIKLGFRLYQLKLEIVVYGLSFLYSAIIGAFIQALVLFASFNFIRPETPITFHFKNVNTCVKVSCIMMIVSISQAIVIPTHITLVGSAIIGLALCMALYEIEYFFESRKNPVYNIPKDTLIAIMENSLLSNEEKDAIQYKVIDKMKGDRFYRAMGYSKRQSIRIYKSAIEKLNNLISQ